MALGESDFLSDIFEKVSHLSRPAPSLTKTGPRRTRKIVDYLCKVAVGFDTIAIRDYGGWLEAAGQEREPGILRSK